MMSTIQFFLAMGVPTLAELTGVSGSKSASATPDPARLTLNA